MTINRHIIFAGAVIGTAGIINGWSHNRANTPVVVGTFVFVLMLALIDAVGGPVSRLASALAMIAVLVVLLDEFPWTTILATISGKKEG